MSSSTSSFSTELRVLAVVASVLAAAELAGRFAGRSLSVDESHVREIPEIARRLHAGRPPRILFLGNSLTRCGVDLEAFRAELRARGVPDAACEKVVPDGTGICEWYYYFKRHFADADETPDVVIVGFQGTAASDENLVRVEKLGQDVCTLRDVPELFTSDVEGFGDRVQFLLSYCFYSVGKQTNMQHRVLSLVVPNYIQETQELNRVVQSGRRKGGPSAPPRSTYRRLDRLMDMLRRIDVRGVFVAMPGATEQTLDPLLVETVREGGMTLIDGRRIERLDAERFFDGVHMDPTAADMYSRFVARAVAEQLKELTVARRLAGGQSDRIASVKSRVETSAVEDAREQRRP
jgi:hypothetical protein